MKIIIPLIILGIVLISGCTGSEDTEFFRQAAIDTCIEECKSIVIEEGDRGPCLLNPIPEHSGWVCDIAHSPREPVDDLPENQCSAYREGTAKHFVEVDINCNLIRAV